VAAIQIRTATPAEIGLMASWAQAEGWNPGLDDVPAFAAADPEGFLIGVIDDRPAACISVVRYGTDFSFLGFFICHPDFRGRGHGMEIWKAGMERLAGRTIGLDGVVAQQANYAKSGFALAQRNIRYGGLATSSEISDIRLVELGFTRPLGLAGALIAYDRDFFPAPRDKFMRAWLSPGGRRTVAFIENDRILGYGCIRPCHNGSKIGPLFAETPEVAERIFGALTSRLRGTPIFLDAPEPNVEAIALAKRHSLEPVFETARMYRGSIPELPLDRIYGITTFELG
jgi:hypothetical protein